MKNSMFITFFLIFSLKTAAQINLVTEDLPRFYQAFDSVSTTNDSLKQLKFINDLYLKKGTEGLKKFVEKLGGQATDFQKMMIQNKQMLIEKRPWIMSVLKQRAEIEQNLERFKLLYPDFRPGKVFFLVGFMISGGTVWDNAVYIGTEVVAWNRPDWAVHIVMHEFGHTQQWTQRNIAEIVKDKASEKVYVDTHQTVLAQCLQEGTADFIAELVQEKSIATINPGGHTDFGLKNEKIVWADFKKDMFKTMTPDMGWIYGNGRLFEGTRKNDLGYFVGHQICKAYYNKAKDKKQAIKFLLEEDTNDANAKKILEESGYDPR